MKIGVDIGGTKCAVVLGDEKNIIRRIQFATTDPANTIYNIEKAISAMMKNNVDGIGISCGGPLDAKSGVILSPPNLIGWDHIGIAPHLSDVFKVPAYLCNDADACALAEHRFGIGRGTQNMVFMTFGTGMGAGLILNGKLYSGTSGMAGEIGHVRMENYGPTGYGKQGSFEGFCSGGGIAQLGKTKALELLQQGHTLPWCRSVKDIDQITAKFLAERAHEGDALAREVYRISAEMLGRGVSVLIDVLNPEMILIGSVYARARDLMEPYMEATIAKESLFASRVKCVVLPSSLGEQIGDYGALAVAYGV